MDPVSEINDDDDGVENARYENAALNSRGGMREKQLYMERLHDLRKFFYWTHENVRQIPGKNSWIYTEIRKATN